jgi:hypothetical protein
MSHSNNDEVLIYTQGDMDNILAQLRKFQKEAEVSHQLVWAILHTVGEVAIPHKTMIEGDATRELIFWDDPSTYVMRVKAKE